MIHFSLNGNADRGVVLKRLFFADRLFYHSHAGGLYAAFGNPDAKTLVVSHSKWVRGCVVGRQLPRGHWHTAAAVRHIRAGHLNFPQLYQSVLRRLSQ
jgi:hypothetical protein